MQNNQNNESETHGKGPVPVSAVLANQMSLPTLGLQAKLDNLASLETMNIGYCCNKFALEARLALCRFHQTNKQMTFVLHLLDYFKARSLSKSSRKSPVALIRQDTIVMV